MFKSFEELARHYGVPGEDRRGQVPATVTDQDGPDEAVSTHAEVWVETANKIKALAGHTRRPVVVLGRDGWPLIPILREMGMEAQYFLWSRISDDAAMGKLWLREVPPGAIVVDTGFAGSIIDRIKRQDPTVVGYLMSTEGKYPSLEEHARVSGGDQRWGPPTLGGGQRKYHKNYWFPPIEGVDRNVVLQMEYTPKLIGRATTVEGSTVKALPFTNDDDNSVTSFGDTIKYNQKLLEACGLQGKWLKYATFTGVKPRERLDMTPRERRQHYRLVRRLRSLWGRGIRLAKADIELD